MFNLSVRLRFTLSTILVQHIQKGIWKGIYSDNSQFNTGIIQGWNEILDQEIHLYLNSMILLYKSLHSWG